MKVLSLFSGIGAFEKALKNINILYELVGFSEIDQPAVKSYCAIHGVDESMNLGDITKIEEENLPKNIDLITYGFPCQDISLAGKQQGLFNEDGSQTRSGLFFEALRIIEATQPKVAIAENVKNLTSKKFSEQFKIVLDSLEAAGYKNYWKVLNAKDYGIPQNRERVFIISIRKDIDNEQFEFPKPLPLELRLKDMLEDEVDEKYYISDSKIAKIQNSKLEQECVPVEASINMVGMLDIKGNEQVRRVYGTDGISPTLNTMQGGNRQPKVVVPEIQRIDIPQTVKVRKYPVDTDKLVQVLREHKAFFRITNRELAEKFNMPVTKVEHWFRRDECFAIPEAETWLELKEFLGIETDEFDEAIMTFEEKEGVYEKSERHYFTDGISPTLTSTSAGNEKYIVREAVRKGYAEAVEGDSINLEQPNSKTRRGRVGHGVAQTITTSPQQAAVVNVPTLKKVGNIYPSGGQNGNVYDMDGISPTIVSGETNTKGNGGIGSSNSPKIIENNLRIRKLTPKECFRLMGFDDADFEKAAEVNSNTQLYKQAGNSIVVDVLEAIFKSLQKAGVL